MAALEAQARNSSSPQSRVDSAQCVTESTCTYSLDEGSTANVKLHELESLVIYASIHVRKSLTNSIP